MTRPGSNGSELRVLAEPAGERLSRGPASDELRARLADMDRKLQHLVPASDARPVRALTAEALASDFLADRAWIERARPALDPWFAAELCGTPPVDDGSETWMTLRDRVGMRLQRGERIATEIPRILALRNWGNVIAWRAFLEAQQPADDDEPWTLDAAGILGSTFPLLLAFDDGSLIGTMGRIHVEKQTLQAARVLLQRGSLRPRALRAALEPGLACSSACEPRAVLEGELRAFLVGYDRARAGQPHERFGDDSDLDDAALLLRHFADVEEAFELAGRWTRELLTSEERVGAGEGSFARTSLGVLRQLERHRSVLALARIALAVAEHRERTGTPPEDLTLLAETFPDGLPVDPLTGAPFPYTTDGARARLGPVACPEHGDGADRHLDWAEAVEQLFAWEF